MKYHILKVQDGVTYVSGIEYDTLKEASQQAESLRDELDDRAEIVVLDDLELLALRTAPGARF